MSVRGVSASPTALVGLRPEPASGLGHSATIADAITAFMQRYSVQRIAELGGGFTVALRGGGHGSGEDVGEAFRNAIAHRAVLERLDS